MGDERFVKLLESSTNQPFDTEYLGGRTEITEVQNPSPFLDVGSKVKDVRSFGK
jgi:hypothetical protein